MDESVLGNQCLYINVRSLTKNYDETELVIRKIRPKLLFMSETRLTEEIDSSEVNVKTYRLIRCDSYTRSTGGVAVYIKAGINYEVIANECITNNVWLLAVQITYGKRW